MNKLVQTATVENKSNIVNVVKGVVTSYIITLVLLFVFSLLLTYTNISEQTIPPVILIITIISILIGSTIGSSKIKKNGIINGGMVGFFYIMLLYLISSLMQTGFSLNLYATLMIVFSIISGMVRRNCWGKLKKIIDKPIEV